MSIKDSIATNPTLDKFGDAMYKAKPTICVVVGMIGTAASVYLAWRAGRKANEVIEEAKADISKVKAMRPTEVVDETTGKTTYTVEEGQLTKSEYNRALLRAHYTALIKLGKLAAPAVITEAASLTAIAYGYDIVNDRFAETAAACQAYAAFMTDYRGRVRDKIGDEEERKLYFGTKEIEDDEPEIDKEGKPKLTKDGKPKMRKTKKEILDEELAKHSPFARVFDPDYCPSFECESDGLENFWYNGKLLKETEATFNHLIRYSQGHVMLINTIYEFLGFKLSSLGAIHGWHCKNVNGKLIFDNGCSEGIKFTVYPIWYRDDNDMLKKTYILDFNVDPQPVARYFDREDFE